MLRGVGRSGGAAVFRVGGGSASPDESSDVSSSEQQEASSSASSSGGELSQSGNLNPALVHADAARAASVKKRPPLSTLFYGNKELHKAVENSDFVTQLRESPDREQYRLYLCRLHGGMKVAEDILAKSSIEGWSPFFRTTHLEQDIASFGGYSEAEEPCIESHAAHMKEVGEKNPKLLLAHLALRYFAILHGGQQRAERLRGAWGDDASLKLYEFGEDSRSVLKKLMEALASVGSSLTDDEFAAFEAEIKTAWLFAGDCVGTDIRPLLTQQ